MKGETLKKIDVAFLKEKWEDYKKYKGLNPELYPEFVGLCPLRGVLFTKYYISFGSMLRDQKRNVTDITDKEWREMMSDEHIWEKLKPILTIMNGVSGIVEQFESVDEAIEKSSFGEKLKNGQIYIENN